MQLELIQKILEEEGGSHLLGAALFVFLQSSARWFLLSDCTYYIERN